MINLVSDKPHYENVPFEIPESWEWVTLRELCSKFSTGPFGSMVHKSDYVTTNGVYLVNPANIINGRIVTDKIMAVSYQKAADLKCYRLNEGDILLARRGDLSKCAIVKKSNIDWLCGTGSFFLHLVFVIPSYFSLLYATEYVQSILQNKSVGATMDNLNQDTLGTLLFPLPPLAEQQRIVTEVEKWFALIDELEANKEDLKEYIKQVKSKVLDLAIHGKLVPQDPNDEPAIELLKRINPNFKPCDTSHYENLPNGWYICDLLDICNISTGKWDANHATENGKYRFYTCSSKHSYSDTKRFSGECLIVPGNGDIGAVYYYKGDFDAYQRTYVLHDVKIFTPYLYYHFLSNWRQINDDKMYGSTIKFVRISNFQNYKVLIPPYEEQIKIVEYLEQFFIFINTISAEL